MGKLSVIMVNYNTGELAMDSLQRIRISMEGIPGEIFFVDNGSTDGSAGAVKDKFQEVKIIANDVNSGFARAVNQAGIRCSGEYLFLINPDVTIHNNTVPQLINFMETFQDAGAVTPYITYPDGRRQDFCSYFPTLARQFFQLTGLRMLVPGMIKRLFLMQGGNKARPFEVDWAIGACMVVRKKAMEDAGHLDEDFFMYGEDMDFCYRLRQKKWKVYVLPGEPVFHIGSPPDTLRSGVFKETLIHHTTYLFFRKHYGLIRAVLLSCMQRTVSLARLSIWCAIRVLSHGIDLPYSTKGRVLSDRMREKAKSRVKIHFACLKGAVRYD